MPYEAAVAEIHDVIVELLSEDTVLTGLIASKPTSRGGGPAIYPDGEVPLGQLFPYVTVGAWTQVPFHSMGSGYGWNCTGQIKAIGQRSQAQVLEILSAALAVLPEGSQIDVTGYASACLGDVNVQPAFKNTLAGVPTIEAPAIIRVYVS